MKRSPGHHNHCHSRSPASPARSDPGHGVLGDESPLRPARPLGQQHAESECAPLVRAREGWEWPRRGGPVARDTSGHVSALGPGCAQPHEPRKLCRRQLGSLGARPKEVDGNSKPRVRVREEPQGGHGAGGAVVPSSRPPSPRCGTRGLAQLAACEVPGAAPCRRSLLGSRCEGL